MAGKFYLSIAKHLQTLFTYLISILQDVQGFIRGQQALQFESEPDGHNEQRAAERGHGHRRGHAPPRHWGQRTNAVGEQFLVFVLIFPIFLLIFVFSSFFMFLCSISLVLMTAAFQKFPFLPISAFCLPLEGAVQLTGNGC